jgi:potassium/chloride transporter 9
VGEGREIPCDLCLFCSGFVVGHAGLLQALAMLLVAYFILALTVLSVCAIATNGAVRGGGAYCILQR